MKNEVNVDVLKVMVVDNSLYDFDSFVIFSILGSLFVSFGFLLLGGILGKYVCGYYLYMVGGVVERDVCYWCRYKWWYFIKFINKFRESRLWC